MKINTIKSLIFAGMFLSASALVSCNNTTKEPGTTTPSSILVLNEGNYMQSNAEITGYNPDTKEATQSLFAAANNGAAMGDAPACGVRFDGKVYISLSGSAKVYAIDENDYTLKGKITNIESPRKIAIRNASTAYVSQLGAASIIVVNPTDFSVTDTIELENNVEEMILDNHGMIFANEWSYGKRIVRIDPTKEKDAIVSSLEVGVQPKYMRADKNGNLWVICDGGGWAENPAGYENPSIMKIAVGDNGEMTIRETFTLEMGQVSMDINKAGDTIYYMLGGKIYSMSVDATEIPAEALIDVEGVYFYNMAVNPNNGDVYATDAVDYTQAGFVYRFSSKGEQLDKFDAAVCPALMVF